MPVACGAKTWTIPFLIPELETSSWTLSDKSMKSISPCVCKLVGFVYDFEIWHCRLSHNVVSGCFAEKVFENS